MECCHPLEMCTHFPPSFLSHLRCFQSLLFSPFSLFYYWPSMKKVELTVAVSLIVIKYQKPIWPWNKLTWKMGVWGIVCVCVCVCVCFKMDGGRLFGVLFFKKYSEIFSTLSHPHHQNVLIFYSFFFFFGCSMCHVGSQLPNQGSNPYPLHWKHGVLPTGLPGKAQYFCTFI